MNELPDEIAARYGRSSSQLKKRRLGVVLAGSGFALLFVIWAIWANLTGVVKPEFKTTGFDIVDPSQVSVSMTVTKPLNTNVICAVRALKQDYGIVGYTEVSFPASDPKSTDLADLSKTITLETTELAVTGVVENCWFY